MSTVVSGGIIDSVRPIMDIDEARLALARERDGRVRSLECQHVATWSEMAALCQVIEEQEDWKLLGFESYHRWLLSAAPQSRSAIYAARGILQELVDVPVETLRAMPLGCARTLSMVPRSKRSKTIVRMATESRPKQFRESVEEKFPDLLVESIRRKAWDFTKSQEKLIDGAIAMVNVIESGEMVEEDVMSQAEALCYVCAEFIARNQSVYDAISKGQPRPRS